MEGKWVEQNIDGMRHFGRLASFWLNYTWMCDMIGDYLHVYVCICRRDAKWFKFVSGTKLFSAVIQSYIGNMATPEFNTIK